VDDTFLIRLKPKQNIKFTSGDLLAVFPNGTETARQYSIAKMGNEILLSIKKHERGRGSSFLYELRKGDKLQASINTNSHFHFPKKTPSAVLIANGTGIAPFLGMMAEYHNTAIHLFWGGKKITSSVIYDEIILRKQNINIYKSYSREGNKQYVQELVLQKKDIVFKTIKEGGVIMICGSLAMQHDVLDVLETIIKEQSMPHSLDTLEYKGQLKMDCY
jgi:sulfite reductase (NADPH) flavoprotein alpha-component